MKNRVEINASFNGTLILAYLITIGSFILAIVNPEAFKLFVDALPYIAGLAGLRAIANGVKDGKSK